ncbi:MAG: aldo/keto reductase, partial [Anaerolineales bacterium]|nr:aldo/keto reductase [Anaerolineales bacterium]
MQYVRLGNSGLQVSRICLGMMSYGAKSWREWVLGEADAEEHVRKALDLGINFFDTANVYSVGVSEEITGRTLLKHVKRDEVVIATKVRGEMREGDVNGSGLSRKHIME